MEIKNSFANTVKNLSIKTIILTDPAEDIDRLLMEVFIFVVEVLNKTRLGVKFQNMKPEYTKLLIL